jgi:hypothetical protein
MGAGLVVLALEIVAANLIAALIGWWIGSNRGRPVAGFWFGFCLWVLGWLIVAVGPDRRPRCPLCKGIIISGATKCLHCSTDLPASEGKARPSPRLGPHVARALILLVVLGIGYAMIAMRLTDTAEDPTAPRNILEVLEPPIVTLAEYSRLSEGMTYSMAASIIGAQGEESGRSDIDGYSTVAYTWSNPDGSNVVAIFQNGRLATKAQAGLE